MSEKQDENDFRIMVRAAARILRRRKLPPIRPEWFRSQFEEEALRVEAKARKSARADLTATLRDALTESKKRRR